MAQGLQHEPLSGAAPDGGEANGPEGAAGSTRASGRSTGLAGKFERIAALQAGRKSVPERDGPLGLTGIGIKELGSVGHKSCHKTTLPYLFEPCSAVHSPWISVAPEGRRYNFIGAHSYINDGGYLRDDVLIGRYCSIGRRVTIGAAGHRLEGLSTSPALSARRPIGRRAAPPEAAERRLGEGRPCLTVIESDVWIGDGAVVMPGVRLGVGSVVGANAVVTHDTLDYGIHVGSPAKLLRRRFADAICEGLAEARWWDLPHEVLMGLPIDEVEEFLAAVGEVAGAQADYPTMVVPPAG